MDFAAKVRDWPLLQQAITLKLNEQTAKVLPLALVRACGASCNRPVTKQRIMALPSRIAAETG